MDVKEIIRWRNIRKKVEQMRDKANTNEAKKVFKQHLKHCDDEINRLKE